MEDDIIRDKTLYNRNRSLRFYLFILPIGCILGCAFIWGEMQNLGLFLSPESDDFLPFQLFLQFMLVAMPCNMAWQEINILRLLQPIQVQEQGIKLRHFLGSWQMIPWEEISAIYKEPVTKKSTFPIGGSQTYYWVVNTRTPAKFAVSRKTTLKFTITPSHDEYQVLLAFIQAHTGLVVKKKVNLLPWQAGRER